MKNNWLVIGGAGYIGSHTIRELISNGNDCVVLDNLGRGIKERVPTDVELVVGDASNTELIIEICKRRKITHILHFAAYMQARESVNRPTMYWDNNLNATLGIVNALPKLNIKQIVFSSSCSVYGNNPEATTESNLSPLSPYAMTKVACEQILEEASTNSGLKLTILRYFNVIGCGNFENSMDSSTETLIPAILNSIELRKPFDIFGDNFESLDGTPVRDYVDVRDLARAHLVAANIESNQNPTYLNVSSGRGTTVKQLVEIMSMVSGIYTEVHLSPPKLGDPGVIGAQTSQQLTDHGWHAEIPIEQSLRDYWESFVLKSKTTRGLHK